MKFLRRQTRNDEERVLPLINVVFLLLIFFMIAGKLSATEPFHVAPPDSATEKRPNTEDVVILFGPDGATALNGNEMPLDDLSVRIAQMIAAGKKLEIRLKADGEADSTSVIELLEVLRNTGVEKLHLLTVRSGA